MGIRRERWPLVGRDEELAALLDAIDSPDVSGVIVAGEAGVGKTRLIREVLALASGRGLTTRWVVATQAASAIPFGALARLLPDSSDLGADRALLLRHTALALQAQGGSRQLVLGVDDAHLLDDSSATLLHQLVAASVVLVLATLRSGEAVPDPILALWKDGLAERLELQALSRGEVEELVGATLGGTVDRLTLHRLWKATLGNTLLLRELLVAGEQQGELKKRDGVWRWSGSLGMTPRLGDLVEARLGRLTSSQRAVLELVAAGEPLGPSVLERCSSPQAIEALERQTVIVVERRGRRLEVRLAHPLYGEIIRNRTPVLRARSVYKQLADAIEALGMRRREDLLRVATWRLATAAPTRPDLLTAAARRAGNADDDLAERLARAAIQAGGGLEAGIALGRALHGQRRYQEAEQLLAGFANQELTRDQRRELAIERSDALRPLHRYTEATAELSTSAAEVSEGGLSDRLSAALAKSHVFDGNVHEALEMASAVLARGSSDGPARAQAVWIAAWALVLMGKAHDALAVLDLHGQMDDQWKDEAPWTLEMIKSIRIAAYIALGRLVEAAELAEVNYRQSLGHQWPWGVKFWALELMNISLVQGRIQTAVQWGMENLAQVPTAGDTTLPHLNLVLPLAVAGDLDGAQAAFEKAEVSRISQSRLARFEVERARRWIAASQGDLSTAISLAVRTADQAQSMGIGDVHAAALHDATRFGGAAQVADRLRVLARRIHGPVVALYATHATALVSKDGKALDRLAESFKAIGAMLLAAEVAAEAAIAHRSAGHEQASRRSVARTLALVGHCEGARTPALRLLNQPPGLTPREHEIAGLAAAGLSNRVIAERLVVSIRTVDNHLQHVFDKLGVRSRRELETLIDNTVALAPGRPSE